MIVPEISEIVGVILALILLAVPLLLVHLRIPKTRQDRINDRIKKYIEEKRHE